MTPSRVVTGTLSERLELIFDRPGFRQMEASMLPLRLLLIVPLVLASPSLAQGTKQGTINRSQHVTTGSRTPVATQPSNNPFRNPIGQGVPPAASANPNLNSNRTNVPR